VLEEERMASEIIGAETASWRELDARHHVHPFSDQAALAAKGVRIITRAEGCWLWDSEGNRILDGMSGLWCVNVGYGRAELVEAARRQMTTLPFYNTFFQCSTAPAIELAARLAAIAPGFDRVFFTNSGSEANDTVIKLVRYFWQLQGQPTKQIMIGRTYAYHGVTLAAASLSGLPNMHPQFDLPLPGFVHVPAPYWFAHGGELTPEEYGRHAADGLERKILELGPETVGAFVGEPVQGAGGVIIPPEGYWAAIQKICRRYDVLLIADEVAKGLSSGYVPIAAVLLGQRVGDALATANEEWAHGFTYSGHPVAAAVALENLRIIEAEGLQQRAGGPLGDHFAAALAGLADHPLVGEARSCGLLGALELVEDKAARRYFPPARKVGLICREHCIANGLVMRAVRDVMILAPPLVITEGEIDEIARRARRALDLTMRDLEVA
jgi:putrescine aminotransferase